MKTYILEAMNEIRLPENVGSFLLRNAGLSTSGSIFLPNLTSGSLLEINFENVDHSFAVVDGSTLVTSSTLRTPEKVIFQKTNAWSVVGREKLPLDPFNVSSKTSDAVTSLSPVLDIDPTKYYQLKLSGSNVKEISNSLPNDLTLIGAGFEPQIQSWSETIPCIRFSGSLVWSDYSSQKMSSFELSNITEAVSCGSTSFSEWSLFVVCRVNATSSTAYQSILCFHQDDQETTWPKILIEASPTVFDVAVFADGNHGGGISGAGYTLASVDLNKHIIELSADGSGNIDAWFDGSHVVNAQPDYHPKTIRSLVLGANWGFSPKGFLSSFNGDIARILLIPRSISPAERSNLRTYLSARYL